MMAGIVSVSRLLARRARDERGVTAIELVIATALMMLVVGAFMAVLYPVQMNIARQGNRSTNNDQARLAMEDLDREIRSAVVLYNPASEPAPTVANYGLRIYTQSNAPTRNGGNPTCVQWRISSRNLLKRTWISGNPGGTAGWRTVAENVVNQDASVPAFVLDTAPTSGGRIVNVTLLVNAKYGDPAFRNVRLAASHAIRNQSVSDPCTPVPAG
jgi:Flp pilus assembly protein TadG